MRFSDVLDIRNGRNQRQVENKNGKYPIYGSGGIMGRADDFICEAETVVIGRKGSINNPIFVDEPFWNVDTAFGLVANKDVLLPKYLYYFCVNFDFERLNTTVTIPSLTKANLLQVEISIPDMGTQMHIVGVMDKICHLIELRQQELHELDQLVKSRFIELFGDPIANPFEWPVKRLAEISLLITNGNTPKGGSENYVDKGIMFLRSQNVWRNRIDLDDVAYIDEATHSAMGKSSVHDRDILITKTGRINTENSSLGRAALFRGKDNSANINGHVYLVRLDGETIPEYVVSILTSEPYCRYIRRVCVGGIDKRQINLDQVEDFPIITPPKAMQQQFFAFVEQVDKSKYYSSLSYHYCQQAASYYKQEWMTCRISNF